MNSRKEVEDYGSSLEGFSRVQSPYEAKRLHWQVALGMIAAITLLGGGIDIAQAHGVFARTSAYITNDFVPMQEHSGHVLLTANTLISHAALSTHTGSRYWLGARAGYTYTTNCVIPGEMKVTYLLPGEVLSDLISPKLSVTVYENQSFFDQAKNFSNNAELRHVTNRHSDVLTFDEHMMTSVAVGLHLSDEIVLIKYPQPQNLDSILADSVNLRIVSAMNRLG